MARLDSLMALKDGWDGPSSIAVTKQALDNYERFIQAVGLRIRLDVAPMATHDGGVRMEWERGPYTYIAELQGDGGMYLCVLGPSARDDNDAEFPSADIRKLVRFFEDGTIVA